MDLKYLHVYNNNDVLVISFETYAVDLTYLKNNMKNESTKLFKRIRMFMPEYDRNAFYGKLCLNVDKKLDLTYEMDIITANVGFNKRGYSLMDYFALTNRPIITHLIIRIRSSDEKNDIFYKIIEPAINEVLNEISCKMCVSDDIKTNERKRSYKKLKKIYVYVRVIQPTLFRYAQVDVYVSFKEPETYDAKYSLYLNENTDELSFLEILYGLIKRPSESFFDKDSKYIKYSTVYSITRNKDIFAATETYVRDIHFAIRSVASSEVNIDVQA